MKITMGGGGARTGNHEETTTEVTRHKFSTRQMVWKQLAATLRRDDYHGDSFPSRSVMKCTVQY